MPTATIELKNRIELPEAVGRPTPKSFWTYQSSFETPLSGPPGFKGNWYSLSPGMRREIMRQHERSQAPQPEAVVDPRRAHLDRKAEVQIAARHSL
jgi:hypothetical protein